jgi:triacylglycerol esterase/lipase EstA (alpha/beta hydrolase family)
MKKIMFRWMTYAAMFVLVLAIGTQSITTAGANTTGKGPEPTKQFRLKADNSEATGEVFVYTTDPDGPIDWPVIITDGLDHNNYRGWNSNNDPTGGRSLYELLNQSDLLEDGKNAGLDFFVLNFDQGAGYIQRNAFLLVKLIQHVNSLNPQHEVVVVGPSMGGVVSRYALAYMEANNISHNTRLFISVDAPQRGANIPLGAQWFVQFFAQKFGLIW